MGATERERSLEEERQCREAALDEALAQTFPASDPVSIVPDPRADTPPSDGTAGSAAARSDRRIPT